MSLVAGERGKVLRCTKINEILSEFCPSVVEDAGHLLIECPAYSCIREKFAAFEVAFLH
jgi:hypothetical protein